MKTGRPTKLTPGLVEQMLALARQGNPVYRCIRIVRVSPATWYRWQARGRLARSGKYFDLLMALEEAYELSKASALSVVRQRMADGDLKAATWYLERTDPENFGPRPTPSVQVGVAVRTGDVTPIGETDKREMLTALVEWARAYNRQRALVAQSVEVTDA